MEVGTKAKYKGSSSVGLWGQKSCVFYGALKLVISSASKSPALHQAHLAHVWGQVSNAVLTELLFKNYQSDQEMNRTLFLLCYMH